MTMYRRTKTKAAKAAWEWWTEVRRSLPILRTVAGHTQRTLAEKLGTTQGNIGQTESGKYETVRMPRLMPWLEALGVELLFEPPRASQISILINRWDRETAEAVGAIVRDLRTTAGLRQSDVAAVADCSTPTVQDVESGASGPRVTTLAAIFIALRYTPKVRRKGP